MGLSPLDLAALGYALVILHSWLSMYGLDFVSFILVAVLGYALISIRLRFRRKVIRDFALSILARIGIL